LLSGEGFHHLHAVGDKVFLDADADGLQDTGEQGLAGVTVRLLDPSDTVLATVTTAAGGSYLFSSLGPGTYRVEVVLPSGHAFSPKDPGAVVWLVQ
jgi:hypothetical protein